MPTNNLKDAKADNLFSLFRQLSNNEVIGIDSEDGGEMPDIDTLPEDLIGVTSDLAETSVETNHINVKDAECEPVNIRFFEDGAKRGSSMFVCTLKQKENDLFNEVDYPLCLAQTVTTCCHRNSDGRIGIEKAVSKTYLIMHKRLLERLSNNDGDILKKRIDSVINSGKKNINICDIISFNPDEKEYAPTKATQILRRQEAALIEYMAESGIVNEDNWMVVDGPLSIKEADYQNFQNKGYRNMVGIEKSFHDKYEKRPFAQTINTLQEGYRTPAFIPRSKRGNTKVALWYLRLRRPDRPNDRSHIVACELLIPEGQEKIETDLINRVSKAILNEAYPLCYGSDERWRTHLYPVFVTEKTCKSLFHSKEILDGILK